MKHGLSMDHLIGEMFAKFLLTIFQICRGDTMDSHRLITFAGHQGFDKQHALVEELLLGYFTQGKFIGSR